MIYCATTDKLTIPELPYTEKPLFDVRVFFQTGGPEKRVEILRVFLYRGVKE